MFKRAAFILLCCLPVMVFGQTDILTGNVFDNLARTVVLQGATIKNLNTKTVAIADKDGHFSIAAKKGDLVSFAMVGYKTDTIYLINLFPKNVYLTPEVNNLKPVDITGTKLSPYLGNLGNPDQKGPVKALDMDKSRGGLRLNLGYGKWRKNQAKIQELEEEEMYLEEIKNNYTEKLVRETLKFKGTKQELIDFMDMYRPSVADVKSQRPFNYEYHIANSYQTWLKLPPGQRRLTPLPKIKADQ